MANENETGIYDLDGVDVIARTKIVHRIRITDYCHWHWMKMKFATIFKVPTNLVNLFLIHKLISHSPSRPHAPSISDSPALRYSAEFYKLKSISPFGKRKTYPQRPDAIQRQHLFSTCQPNLIQQFAIARISQLSFRKVGKIT